MTVNHHPDPVLGSGLFRIRSGHLHRGDDGDEIVTTVERQEPNARRSGTWLIWGSVALLAALAGVCFYVSYAAQFWFVYGIKRIVAVANAEAVIPDAGMLICAMLALAMAVRGRSAKVARAAVVGFAALSAVMNYQAADSSSAHSIIVYVMPPVAFAVCTDLVVSVVRRFYYGIEEGSPWIAIGRFLGAAVRVAGMILMYALRLLLAWSETWAGLRQMVLDAAPVPAARITAPPLPEVTFVPPGGTTKKAQLLTLYRQHKYYGDRSQASQLAAELGPRVGLQPGTARTYIYAELNALESAS
jgi:hypothetical protein